MTLDLYTLIILIANFSLCFSICVQLIAHRPSFMSRGEQFVSAISCISLAVAASTTTVSVLGLSTHDLILSDTQLSTNWTAAFVMLMLVSRLLAGYEKQDDAPKKPVWEK